MKLYILRRLPVPINFLLCYPMHFKSYINKLNTYSNKSFEWLASGEIYLKSTTTWILVPRPTD